MLRVLVPSDGSANSLHGLRHVIGEFTKNRDLAIHVLNVQPPFSQHVCDFSSKSDRMDLHREQSEQALVPVRQALDDAGVPYTVHLEVGDKADCIVETARRLGCDCIVMSTARKSSLVRMVENSITNQVIERATVPVEVIPGEPASRLERFGIPAGVGAGILVLWMAAS
ncbi:universal stress protein [Acidovorax sp.]|uniref:universal stress protein n=1 Tax=Acidovorax sp. TaxID=1872122 RepID=UPI00391F705F